MTITIDMNIMNTILLLLTCIYGIAFGVRNTLIRTMSILTGKPMQQSSLGSVLDAAFLVSIAYFLFFNPDFVISLFHK